MFCYYEKLGLNWILDISTKSCIYEIPFLFLRSCVSMSNSEILNSSFFSYKYWKYCFLSPWYNICFFLQGTPCLTGSSSSWREEKVQQIQSVLTRRWAFWRFTPSSKTKLEVPWRSCDLWIFSMMWPYTTDQKSTRAYIEVGDRYRTTVLKGVGALKLAFLVFIVWILRIYGVAKLLHCGWGGQLSVLETPVFPKGLPVLVLITVQFTVTPTP